VDGARRLARWCRTRFLEAPFGARLLVPVLIFGSLYVLGERLIRQPVTAWAFDVALVAFLLGWLASIAIVGPEIRKLGWWRLLDLADSERGIQALSWREFERFVAAWFAKQGWHPQIVGRAGPDGGIDIVMRKGRIKAIVQCKLRRGTAAYIEERALREFVGVIVAEKADRGFFVTSRVFSPEAVDYAARVPLLELVAGDELFGNLERCPDCGSEMRIKPSRRGPFLSCVRYPDCKGARNLPAAA
jgi:restriction system protein